MNPSALRLSLQFDAARLHAELDRVPQETWQGHFNQRIYDGDWSMVLSEPETLDTLLRWPTPDNGTETAQALLAAMGQARRESDASLFLKTNCWSSCPWGRIDRASTAPLPYLAVL